MYQISPAGSVEQTKLDYDWQPWRRGTFREIGTLLLISDAILHLRSVPLTFDSRLCLVDTQRHIFHGRSLTIGQALSTTRLNGDSRLGIGCFQLKRVQSWPVISASHTSKQLRYFLLLQVRKLIRLKSSNKRHLIICKAIPLLIRVKLYAGRGDMNKGIRKRIFCDLFRLHEYKTLGRHSSFLFVWGQVKIKVTGGLLTLTTNLFSITAMLDMRRSSQTQITKKKHELCNFLSLLCEENVKCCPPWWGSIPWNLYAVQVLEMHSLQKKSNATA